MIRLSIDEYERDVVLAENDVKKREALQVIVDDGRLRLADPLISSTPDVSDSTDSTCRIQARAGLFSRGGAPENSHLPPPLLRPRKGQWSVEKLQIETVPLL